MTIRGNLDASEATLEALLQTAVCLNVSYLIAGYFRGFTRAASGRKFRGLLFAHRQYQTAPNSHARTFRGLACSVHVFMESWNDGKRIPRVNLVWLSLFTYCFAATLLTANASPRRLCTCVFPIVALYQIFLMVCIFPHNLCANP